MAVLAGRETVVEDARQVLRRNAFASVLDAEAERCFVEDADPQGDFRGCSLMCDIANLALLIRLIRISSNRCLSP